MVESRFSKTIYPLALVAILTCVVFVLMVAPIKAHATTAKGGATVHSLKQNITYTKYDATGDRRADVIRVSASGSSDYAYENLDISINGKSALSKKTWFYNAKVQLIQLKNGKCFFYVYAPMDNGDAEICAIYAVKDGRLKKVIDCNKGFGRKIGNHFGGEIEKVSGNSMTVSFRVMAYMSGQTYGEYTYRYKSGTLRCTGKYGTLKVGFDKGNVYRAKKSMTAYKSATSKSKKFTIGTGRSVKFLKVYVKGNTVRYQVKAGGKIGWIKVANNMKSPLLYKKKSGNFYYREPPFEGLYLAG